MPNSDAQQGNRGILKRLSKSTARNSIRERFGLTKCGTPFLKGDLPPVGGSGTGNKVRSCGMSHTPVSSKLAGAI